MSEAIENPATAARHLPRRRRWVWSALVVLVLAGAGLGGWVWYERRSSTPPPPRPELEGADPAVVETIDRQRQEVLQAPRSAAAWGRLGLALAAFNYRPEAIVSLAQAEHLDPADPRWPYHQGMLQMMDDAEEALACFRRAAELSGTKTDVPRLRVAEGLLAQGHLDEADSTFRALLQRDPRNPRVRLGLGRMALQRQRYREALPHLQQAAGDPHTARAASIALAEVHQLLGEQELAAEHRRRIEQLPPDRPWPDPFTAEVQEFSTGKRVRLMQADRLFRQGRADEAVARYEQVVADYPDSQDGWFALGQAQYRLRDHAAAERSFRKVIEMTLGFAEAHNYLGLAQMGQGRLPGAAASFRKAIELKPDFGLAYFNLGRCLQQQKETKEAIKALRQAIHCKPDHAPAYTLLAGLLHQSGEDEEARELLRQALRFNPSDNDARRLQEEIDRPSSAKPNR